MPLEDIGVRAVIDNLGGFLSGMDRMGNKTAALGKKMTKLGKTMALKVTAPLVAMGGLSLKMAADFDKGMREVNTLLQLSGDQFEELRADVLALSDDIGKATSDVVPALYQAISAGVPRENVMEFLAVASKAAIGGVTDTQIAVDGLTTIINAYGKSADEAGRIADIMFTAVKLGKLNFEELSASLFNVVPIAAATGVGFEEVAAGMAALTAQGVPASVAATQLRGAIQALSAPTIRQRKLMEELGLNFNAARLQQIGLSAAFKEAIAATDGNMEQLRRLVGSVEGLQAVLALGGEQSAKFTFALDAMAESAGASQMAFEEMEESASRRFERLIVKVKNLALAIGEELLPMAEKLAAAMSRATEFMTKAAGIFGALPGPLKTIAIGFVGILAAAGPVLIIVGTLVSSIGSLTVAAGAASTWLAGLGLSFTALLGPIGLVALAIGALAILWIKDIGGIRDATKGIFQSIADLFASFETLFDSFTEAMRGLGVNWRDVWNTIERALEIVWTNVLHPIFNAVHNAIDVLTIAVSILAGDWGTAWDKIKDIMARTVNLIIDKINLVLDGFAAMVKGLKAVLDAVPGPNKLGNALQKAIDVLENGIPRLKTFTRELGAMDEMLVHLGQEELPTYEEQADAAAGATGEFGDETEEATPKIRALGDATDDLTGRMFELEGIFDDVVLRYAASLTNLETLGIGTDIYTGLVKTLTRMTGNYREALALVTNQMEQEYRQTLQGVITDTLTAAEATEALAQSLRDLNMDVGSFPPEGREAAATPGASVRSQSFVLGFPSTITEANFQRIIAAMGGIGAAAAQAFLLDILGGKEPFTFSGIPRFGFGGVMAQEGRAIVGEQGPEVVSLPAGARVTPLGREGDTFNVEINHVDSTEDDIIMDMDTVKLLAQT